MLSVWKERYYTGLFYLIPCQETKDFLWLFFILGNNFKLQINPWNSWDVINKTQNCIELVGDVKCLFLISCFESLDNTHDREQPR